MMDEIGISLKKKRHPKPWFKIMDWMVKIGIILVILYGCSFITMHIFFLHGEHRAFEDAKHRILSWDLPPQTELVDLRTQRINIGTFCVAGVDMIIDSKLSRNVIEGFYFESTSRQYDGGYISEIEHQPNDIKRYTLHFEMNVYNYWNCA